MHREDEHRHRDEIALVGVAPNGFLELDDLAELVDRREISNLDVAHVIKGSRSGKVLITGRFCGNGYGTSPERLSNTACQPALSAPSMSCLKLSPTIIASPALTFARSSAFSKKLGCGFM